MFKFSNSLKKINAVAESIKNASGELNTTSSKLDENLNIILERLEEIDQSQKEMSSQLNNMNSKVQETSQTNYLVSK